MEKLKFNKLINILKSLKELNIKALKVISFNYNIIKLKSLVFLLIKKN